VHDEHADQPHAHLGHLVVMGVEHEAPVLAQRPLVSRGFPGLDVRLCQPPHAVHPVGEIQAMPVDRGRHRQAVRHVDPDALTLHRLDHRAVHAAVVPPAVGPQARVKGVVDLLHDEVKHLHPTRHLEGQGAAVRYDDGPVVLSGQPRRQRSDIHPTSAVALLPVRTPPLGRWRGRAVMALCVAFLWPYDAAGE
jgi:hypothetical protein